MKVKKSILILGMLTFIACGKDESKNSDSTKYRVDTAQVGKASGYINVDGNIEANDTKKVFVDKKLKVKEVFVQEGDYVEKDQLLMTFDETERNNIKRNLEKEMLALSKLKRDYKVEKELNKIGGSSDNYVKDLNEQIRTKELTIESLEEDLEKTAESIKSPVSGTITTLTAQENYSVNTDEPLMEIADLSDMKIVLEVPEYDVKNIKLGQSLIIKPEVFEKKKSYNGKVTKISKISKVSEETSENVLEVEVSPEEKIPYIVPGFKVSSTIYLNSGEDGLIIPKTAMLYKDGKYVAFIVDKDRKISERNIEFQEVKGNYVKVISGISNGERYLVAPKNSLSTGMLIDVLEERDEKL